MVTCLFRLTVTTHKIKGCRGSISEMTVEGFGAGAYVANSTSSHGDLVGMVGNMFALRCGRIGYESTFDLTTI